MKLNTSNREPLEKYIILSPGGKYRYTYCLCEYITKERKEYQILKKTQLKEGSKYRDLIGYALIRTFSPKEGGIEGAKAHFRKIMQWTEANMDREI